MISALLVSTLLGANVGERINEVRRAFIEDGVDRVSATSTHRVISHADGSLELQGAQPLKLSLQSITRATSCTTTMISRLTLLDSPNMVRSLRGCDVEESWTNTAIGLEHAFTILRAPAGSGGFTLFVRVDGPWHHADEEGHVFQGPGAAHSLRYGRAFVVRADQRIPIEVVHVEGGLELRVPASLADAPGAFPMEIDPVLSTEVSLDPAIAFIPSPSPDESPAIAVNSAGQALVVWADTRRQLGADLFGARISASGTLVDPVGIPLNITPGHQIRPALCGDGRGYLLAWDTPVDAGFQIRARAISELGVPGGEFFVVNGSQPALAAAGDAGLNLMAYIDPSSKAQVLPIMSSSVGPTVSRPAITDEIAARPAIAASNRGWFAAWEVTTAGGPVSIRGMASGSSGASIVPVFDNMTAVPARRPTVALASISSTTEDAFVLWEQGITGTSGARVSNVTSTTYFNFAGSSPALARTSVGLNALPTLGSFVLGRLQFRDLNDGGVSSLPVGPQPSDLVLAANPRIFAAWSESPRTESDIYGAVLVNAATNTQEFLVSRAANSQRNPRVAIVEDTKEGIAVWLEGTTTIYGAKVVEDQNGLRIGSRFQIATSANTIQQLDVAAVASGTNTNANFLVTWRTGGLGALTAQLVSTSSTVDAPLALSLSGASAGPAVAWDEGSQEFQVAWNQGTEIVTTSVDPIGGGIGVRTSRAMNEQANDVAINCLRGNCALAWERPSREVAGVVFGSINPPLFTRGPPAGSPALANDGADFYLAWHSASGITFAKIDFTTGAATNTGTGILTTGNNAVTSLHMASATPPVIAWSELTPMEEVNLSLQRLDLVSPPVSVGVGFNAGLAVSGSNTQPSGLVVYQRYLPSGLNTMRVFGKAFSYVPDAGYLDGGFDAGVDAGVDAGTDAGTDGGEEDAGLDAGPGKEDAGVDAGVDGGVQGDGGPVMFETSGCGCQMGSGSPLLGILLMLALRRRVSLSLRQRGEGQG